MNFMHYVQHLQVMPEHMRKSHMVKRSEVYK